MRILFVAQAVSIHTARWINQLKDEGWDIHLFDMRGSFPHAALRGITEYSLLFPRKIPGSKPVSYDHPFFLKYGLDPFPLSLVGFFTRRIFRNRVKLLSRVIQSLQPDIIHSIEMQAESYPLLDVIPLLGGKLPAPWIVTTWGSDIYYYQQFPEHVEKIHGVLQNCQYLLPDCKRDEVLAREHGFTGVIPLILPGAGAYAVSEMQKMIQPGPVSRRRLIMLKGYQSWAGQALQALKALEACAEYLKDFEVIVYSATPSVLDEVVKIQKNGKLNISILPRSPHFKLLKLFGKARVAIGINRTDGIPNAMLEAMTMNAFPIQSDTNAISEWIRDGVNGLMVDPEDLDQIVDAIKRAITDDDLVNRAAEVNTDIVYQRLDVSIVKSQVIEMYKSIAADGKRHDS
jgi:glycosyltransferase involved in cell wall biosynthesis